MEERPDLFSSISDLTIRPSEEELLQEPLDEATLKQVRDCLLQHGIVVLEGVMPEEKCRVLHEKMKEDLQKILSLPTDKQNTNYSAGHVQHVPPPFPPYFFGEMVVNGLVMQIIRDILGPAFALTFYSGNTNMPHSVQQPLHVDAKSLWPNVQHPHPPYALILNAALTDITEKNGSMQAWPGTHLALDYQTDDEYRILEEDKATQGRTPVRANMKAGSLLIRDNRLWHRGMTNESEEPRMMPALIYTINWLRKSKLELHPSCEEVMTGLDLHNIDFVEGINYLHL